MSSKFILGAVAPTLLPELLAALCQDDRACEFICPELAIEITDRASGERDWILTPGRCTGCGLCIAACPEHAIAGRPLVRRPRKQITVTLK